MSVSKKGKILISSFLVLSMICIISIPFTSEPAMSFSSGAPAGYCGAPADGNSNCSSCHNGPTPTLITGAINSNIPVSGYVAGTTYTISAKIVRRGHSRFGFQVSPQDLSGNLIGSMSDLGPETSFTGFGKYITHSSNGTMGTDSVTWYFEWVAPTAGTGSFTFYGAFNATDNSGGNSGDTIFVTSLSIPENISSSIVAENNSFANLVITQNNFSNQIGISFLHPQKERVIISLFGLDGKSLGEIFNEYAENQNFSENLNLPILQSQGIYFLKIISGNQSHTEKIFLSNN